MKKPIAQSIRKLAETLPQVFEEKEDKVIMTGEELLLTPYADKQEIQKGMDYEVPVPMYVAVDHYQQLKDRLKKGGIEAVKEYADNVVFMHQHSEKRNIAL
jgi:hypothetical protein